jgi:hypothetical protein
LALLNGLEIAVRDVVVIRGYCDVLTDLFPHCCENRSICIATLFVSLHQVATLASTKAHTATAPPLISDELTIAAVA